MTFICPRSVSYTAALCAALQHNTHTTHTQQHSRPLRETTMLIREGCLYLLSTHPSMVDHTHSHTDTQTHTHTHTHTPLYNPCFIPCIIGGWVSAPWQPSPFLCV